MNSRSRPRSLRARSWRVLSVLALAWVVSRPAAAMLGGNLASLDADQAALAASEQVTDATGYRIYALTMAGGTVVREYVSPAGTVFALSWEGPLLPDLRQLLGDYFTQYSEAAQAQHRGHAHLAIHRAHLVVESDGRLRAFAGRAYLPEQLPAGFDLADLQ